MAVPSNNAKDVTSQCRTKCSRNGKVIPLYLRNSLGALAGVVQWTECRPTSQRVAGLIPSQGTCLGCGPGPQ